MASLTDYEYLSVRDHALPLVRGIINGILESESLDAIVYPTVPARASLVSIAIRIPRADRAAVTRQCHLPI